MKMTDRDDRPSWREIDRRRDRSRHVRREEGERKEQLKDRWKSGRVREALERLFKGEKGTIEHDKLLNKLHGTYGTEKFLKNAKLYLEKYGTPDDFSTLLLFLDLKDEEILAKTIEKIKKIFPTFSEREKEDIKRKLNILSLSLKSKDIKALIKEVLYL